MTTITFDAANSNQNFSVKSGREEPGVSTH